MEVAQANLAWTGGEAEAADSADPVILAVDVKTVQVEIAPVKDYLERVMEVSDGTVTADQKPTPDHEADTPNPGVKLVDLDPAHIFHNTARVSGNRGHSREVIDYEEEKKLLELSDALPPVWNSLHFQL